MERRTVTRTSQKLENSLAKQFSRGRTTNLKQTISKQTQPRIVRPPAISNFVADDMGDIAEGMRIEHQRFGIGVVKTLDGPTKKEKATIDFEEFGEKTLVLKFAKLRKA